MKIRAILLIVLLLGTVSPHILISQPAANPAGTAGAGNWTVVMSGAYTNQQLDNLKAVSKRLIFRSSWGAAKWFDFYLTGGFVQLGMNRDTVGINDYKDKKYRFALGGGFRISLLSIKKRGFGIWAGGQVLRFKSMGSFIEPLENFDREYALTYNWKEFEGYAAGGVSAGMFTFYAGVNLWALDRSDIKKQYLTSANSSTFIGEEKGEYKSGMLAGGTLGVEFPLPGRFVMNIEGRYFKNDNFQIMVGIGQTGTPSWNMMPNDE